MRARGWAAALVIAAACLPSCGSTDATTTDPARRQEPGGAAALLDPEELPAIEPTEADGPRWCFATDLPEVIAGGTACELAREECERRAELRLRSYRQTRPVVGRCLEHDE